MKIGFIGFGNMAHAIANGIIEHNLVEAKDIVAFDPYPNQVSEFKHKIMLSSSALQVMKETKFVFICVKPQMLDEALAGLRGEITDDNIFISIVAWVTVKRISDLLETTRPIVRVMPNTPLMIGKGCTAVARPEGISQSDYDFIFSVFNSIGYAFNLPEEKINEIIPINGSSPAAIYYFAKIFAENAEKDGIDFDEALKAFSYTLIGSAEMMLTSGRSVDELITMVCSKGGTTLAMLDAFRENGFDKAVASGIDACVKRAYELGK